MRNAISKMAACRLTKVTLLREEGASLAPNWQGCLNCTQTRKAKRVLDGALSSRSRIYQTTFSLYGAQLFGLHVGELFLGHSCLGCMWENDRYFSRFALFRNSLAWQGHGLGV